MWILFTLILIFLSLFYFYRRRKFYLFSLNNFPGPEPNFLFGNLIEYRNNTFYDLLIKWERIYGKLFVYFEGPTPNIVIGDPDILQEVLVKQFSNFHGRKLFPMQRNPDKDQRASMFIARGKRWKRLRTTINPAFSESKMRRMFPIIDESIDIFINKINENVVNKGGSANVQEYLQRLTMDIICKCAFGVESDCQTNINHPFIVCLKKFLSETNFSTWKAAIVLTFPEIKPLIVSLLEIFQQRPAQREELVKIRSTLIQVIEARKKCSEKRFDLLQMLIDAEVPGTKLLDEDNLCPMNDNTSLMKTESQTDEEKTDEEISDKTSSKNKINTKPLTTEEVISQANLFLFAGYETSSTALSYILHSLAVYPEYQEILYQEIENVHKKIKNQTVGSLELYDALVKLPYLNAVIYETLRFYPFASTVIHRICLKSEGTYLSNGQYIKEGTNIIPNVYAIHFDKNIWTSVDPYKFSPERFLQNNGTEYEFIGPPHPFAWLPFGAGPRNCIGQRFAMMVIKATLGRFVHQFKVIKTNDTANPLKLKVGATISPVNGVHIAIHSRNI